MKTELLKEDHEELLKICKQVNAICSKTLCRSNIKSIMTLMNELLIKLEVHLICEDKYLYPYLLKLELGSINKVATNFKTEMGGLNDNLQEFFTKWRIKSAYSNNVEFVCELCDLVGNIQTRILKEETVLFPMMKEGIRSQYYSAA